MNPIFTLIHSLSTAELIYLPLLGMAVLSLFYGCWQLRRGSGGSAEPLKDRLKVNQRIEQLEYLTSDLQGRFNRFQRREGMKEARSALDLQNEAAEVLGHTASAAAATAKPAAPTAVRRQNWFKKR